MSPHPAPYAHTSIHWRVWTRTGTEGKARLVLQRLLAGTRAEPVDLTVTPYPKTEGHELTFTTSSDATRWADLVLEALCLGDELGREWRLVGQAAEDLSGWSNKPRASGAVSLRWQVDRGELARSGEPASSE